MLVGSSGVWCCGDGELAGVVVTLTSSWSGDDGVIFAGVVVNGELLGVEVMLVW